MSNSAFQPTVLTVPSGTGGSGQGELNLVTNPTATTDTTGWAAGAGATLGRGTGGGPLNPTVSTYFTTINTAGSESSTSGAYDVLTLPSGMQNKKLKVEFYFTSPASDTFKVSVYKGSTRVPLSTDSAGSTSLPQSTTGKFTAYFDTDSSGTWTVSITKTAGPGSTPLQFTNVVVGPGIQPQGAVVGEWTSYTPTLTGSTNGSAYTNQTTSGRWRRVGDTVDVEVFTSFSGAPGAGTGFFKWSLPNNVAIDLTKVANTRPNGTSTIFCAAYNAGNGISGSSAAVAIESSGFRLLFTKNPISSDYMGASFPAAFASGDFVRATASFPIAEWAGSGTVQLAQNDVEYAYNTSGLTTAGGSNTFAFGYGPVGAVLGSIASTTQATSYTTMRVRFQTPIQAGDSIVVEFDGGQNQWMPAPNRSPWIINNAAVYGVQAVPVFGSLTDVDVLFGNSGQQSSGATTYGSSGSAWSNISTWKWRVRKSSAGAAVGFGIVQPGVSSGLVSSSGLPGNTSGQAIAAGYVGEKLAATWTGQTINTTPTTLATISTVSAGTYLVIIGTDVGYSTTTRITSSLGGTATYILDRGPIAGDYARSLETNAAVLYVSYYLQVSNSGSIFFTSTATTAATSATSRGYLNLIRIA